MTTHEPKARVMRLTPKAHKALRESDIKAGRWPEYMRELAAQVAEHKPLRPIGRYGNHLVHGSPVWP